MKSDRAKACDIKKSVKDRVFERDGGACVICGSRVNVMPNAHYIPRSKGGLGCEENVVTLCSNLSEHKCHYRYDFGTREEREEIGEKIKAYLQSKYPDWDEDKLVYDKNAKYAPKKEEKTVAQKMNVTIAVEGYGRLRVAMDPKWSGAGMEFIGEGTTPRTKKVQAQGRVYRAGGELIFRPYKSGLEAIRQYIKEYQAGELYGY